MQGYEYGFKCTVHNLRFAFDQPDSVEPALLRCPVCVYENDAKRTSEMQTLREHRDLLLRAIDLKKLLQAE